MKYCTDWRTTSALLVVLLACVAPIAAQIGSGDIRVLTTPDAMWAYGRFTARAVGPAGEAYVQDPTIHDEIDVYASVSAWQMGSAPTRSFTFVGLTGGWASPGGHQMIYVGGSLYAPAGSGGAAMVRADAATGVPLPTTLVSGSTGYGWGGIANTGLTTDGIYIYAFKGSNLEIYDLSEVLVRTVPMPFSLNALGTCFAAAGYFYPVRYTTPTITERVRASDGAILPWSDQLTMSLGCSYLTNANYDYYSNRLLHTTGNPGSCLDTTYLYNNVVIAAVEGRTVDAAPLEVTTGTSGHAITFSAENISMSTLNVTGITLSFTDATMADVSAEYVVTPAPGNPTAILAAATENFDFTVDVLPGATLGTITIDAGIDVINPITMATFSDSSADTQDTWEVVACAPPLCGDCNGDTLVTILDALVAAQHSAGLVILLGPDFTACNVIGLVEPDPAAEVSILDALTLAQSAAGLPIALMCC